MTPLSKKGTVQDSSCQSLLLYVVIKLYTVIVSYFAEQPQSTPADPENYGGCIPFSVKRCVDAPDELAAHITDRSVVQLNFRPFIRAVFFPRLLYETQHCQRIPRILFAQDRAIGIGLFTDPHTLAFDFGAAHFLIELDTSPV